MTELTARDVDRIVELLNAATREARVCGMAVELFTKSPRNAPQLEVAKDAARNLRSISRVLCRRLDGERDSDG